MGLAVGWVGGWWAGDNRAAHGWWGRWLVGLAVGGAGGWLGLAVGEVGGYFRLAFGGPLVARGLTFGVLLAGGWIAEISC